MSTQEASSTNHAQPHEPRCSECGLLIALNARPGTNCKPGLIELVPVIAMGLSIIIIAGFLWLNSGTNTTSSASNTPKAILPLVTPEMFQAAQASPADARDEALAEIAGGIEEASTNAFPHVGGTKWYLMWARLSGNRTQTHTRGWPIPWFTKSSTTHFRDPIQKTGMVPWRVDPTMRPVNSFTGPGSASLTAPRDRWEWAGRDLAFMPPPEETGGRFETTRFSPVAILLPVAAGLAAWGLVSSLLLLSAFTRRRPISKRHARVCMLLGLLIFAASGLTNFLMSDSNERVSTNFQNGTIARIGGGWFQRFPTGVEIESLSSGRADRGIDPDWLVATLGSLTPSDPTRNPQQYAAPFDPEQKYVLAVAPVHETMMPGSKRRSFSEGFNIFSMEVGPHLRHPDFGPIAPIQPRGLQYAYRFNSVFIIGPAKNGTDTVRLMVSVPLLVMVITGTGLVGLFSLAVRGLIRARIKRRRISERRCTACGYAYAVKPAFE